MSFEPQMTVAWCECGMTWEVGGLGRPDGRLYYSQKRELETQVPELISHWRQGHALRGAEVARDTITETAELLAGTRKGEDHASEEEAHDN